MVGVFRRSLRTDDAIEAGRFGWVNILTEDYGASAQNCSQGLPVGVGERIFVLDVIFDAKLRWERNEHGIRLSNWSADPDRVGTDHMYVEGTGAAFAASVGNSAIHGRRAGADGAAWRNRILDHGVGVAKVPKDQLIHQVSTIRSCFDEREVARAGNLWSSSIGDGDQKLGLIGIAAGIPGSALDDCFANREDTSRRR